MKIDVNSFPDPGLYLLMPDGKRLDLTHAAIDNHTRGMLDSPDAIPPEVREATEYTPCRICPARYTAEICHAIMPALLFFEDIDSYMSYDQVTAVYLDPKTELLMIKETTMAEALVSITILSLTTYCDVGIEYRRYFTQVNPMLPLKQIGRDIFLNVYADCNGDLEKTEQTINKMSDDVLLTARCQNDRLNLICKRDAFINAYVNTDLIMEYVRRELNALRKTTAGQH